MAVETQGGTVEGCMEAQQRNGSQLPILPDESLSLGSGSGNLVGPRKQNTKYVRAPSPPSTRLSASRYYASRGVGCSLAIE